jgi:hypothetical protein
MLGWPSLTHMNHENVFASSLPLSQGMFCLICLSGWQLYWLRTTSQYILKCVVENTSSL